jgi:DNA segregation ATPase FtsK/SpoIIIE-like protein
MKTISKTFILIFVLNAFVWLTPQKASAQVSVNFQIFYDNLSPYGDWVFNPQYGYVWVPDVSNDFTPYNTNGYWAFTNVGWTWVSNYSWGWAPFHYGRWMYDNYYGWSWIPGREWGPGWVSWRRSEGYYGWAPIGPGISITFAYSSGYRIPNNQWTFVRDRDFGRTNINNYYVNSSSNITIIRRSTVINNIQVDNSSRVRYNSGPNRTEVQRQTGRSIAPVAVRERNNPGQNLGKGELQIYRPRVTKNNSNGQKPAPYNVVKKEDIKPSNQRSNQPQDQQQRYNERANQQQSQQRDQQQRNNNKANQQQDQQQRNNERANQQQDQQQRNNERANQQQDQQQRNNERANQQQDQQQRNNEQAKQQQDQQQRNNEQAKQQQDQQQRNNEQARQQQEQNNNQQAKQQQEQQQRNNEQAKQQQDQQQRNNEQARQQQDQQQKNDQQAKQQQQGKRRSPKQEKNN